MSDIDWQNVTRAVDGLRDLIAQTNAAIKDLRAMDVIVYVHADGNEKNDFIEADASIDLFRS